jgi:menaquinol-cytochrome c reductase iron-sulfur subunit
MAAPELPRSDDEQLPPLTRPARRTFVAAAVGIISLIWAALTGWALGGSLVGPMYRKIIRQFVKVVRIASIPTGTPSRLTFPYVSDQGFIQQTQTHVVWVIKHSDTDLTVFSPICPHLGCHIKWSAENGQFFCPCHGSVFSENGTVLAGPAPRPLDTLPYRVEDGELLVRWERFKPGSAAKTPV